MRPWSLLTEKFALHPQAGHPQLEDCSFGSKWFLAGSLVDLPKFAKHKTGGSNLFPFGSLIRVTTLVRSEIHTL